MRADRWCQAAAGGPIARGEQPLPFGGQGQLEGNCRVARRAERVIRAATLSRWLRLSQQAEERSTASSMLLLLLIQVIVLGLSSYLSGFIRSVPVIAD